MTESEEGGSSRVAIFLGLFMVTISAVLLLLYRLGVDRGALVVLLAIAIMGLGLAVWILQSLLAGAKGGLGGTRISHYPGPQPYCVTTLR